MNPNMKCTCLFGNPEIGMDHHCPVHGIERIIPLEKFMQKHMDWAVETFPKSTPHSSLTHLQKELYELKAEIDVNAVFPHPSDKSNLIIEYIDCINCLLTSAAKSGIAAEELAAAYARKLVINMLREWKDNGDGTYSHVKNN